ncbi:MAG: hypothetical protein KKD44_22675 [Proteobacteria bacterium]|nr:hypothetical protein [Pseudomonadota bacterium]
MQIAGVRYLIDEKFTAWTKNLEIYDRSFFINHPVENHPLDLTLHIRNGSMPDTNAMTCLTVRDSPWLMYRKENTYCMVFRHPGYDDQVMWAALFDNEGRHTDIFLNEETKKIPCPPSSHHLDQIIIAFTLASRKGALVHGAGMGLSGKGLVFTGHSGAGKSTLSRLFSHCETAILLSDERLVIRKMDMGMRVYGTPWHSDAKIANNSDFPLRAIIHLHHALENKIVRCSSSAALKQILPQVMIPWYDREKIPPLLDFCGEIIEQIPAYDFFFKPDQSAVNTILDFAERL